MATDLQFVEEVKGTEVSGKTQVCALIGDPVEHSVSPKMHNAAFKKLGLDFVYVPFRVKPDQLSQAVDGFRAMNVKGFNVTIPHKVSIIPMLDGLDPRAEKIGAVNTVVNCNGELRGSNTDAEGFIRSLRESGVEPEGKNVVIIGAGGAARAISYVLTETGAHLTIVNRQLELDWADAIALMLKDEFGRAIRVMELTDDYLAQAMENAHILVNATSVGMSPDSGTSPVPASLLRPDLTVFDVVYNPLQTRLLREAADAGARTISGIEMLVWQGVLAFEKWTCQKAPLKTMRREALKQFEKNEK